MFFWNYDTDRKIFREESDEDRRKREKRRLNTLIMINHIRSTMIRKWKEKTIMFLDNELTKKVIKSILFFWKR